jgi:hypothetical protein
MKEYKSAHRAAVAKAREAGNHPRDWAAYTDALIAERAIRPVLDRNGNKTGRWFAVRWHHWWHVRTEVFEKPRVMAGPFETKREALRVAGVTTAKKDYPGCYRMSGGAEWSLLAVTTRFAREEMGLKP